MCVCACVRTWVCVCACVRAHVFACARARDGQRRKRRWRRETSTCWRVYGTSAPTPPTWRCSTTSSPSQAWASARLERLASFPRRGPALHAVLWLIHYGTPLRRAPSEAATAGGGGGRGESLIKDLKRQANSGDTAGQQTPQSVLNSQPRRRRRLRFICNLWIAGIDHLRRCVPTSPSLRAPDPPFPHSAAN